MSIDTEKPSFSIRICENFDDYTACINLQRVVWQFSDLDITPLRSFVITRRSGGLTLGAFDPDNRLLGFAHALAAFDASRQPYFYSHMLAVDPEVQNAGIGAKLKLSQRDYALARGIPLLGWTFDPLMSRNAYLNIVKLGAVVRRYYPNYYGNASTSVLHRGLDTDRLFVEWWVESDHVRDALAGRSRGEAPAAVVEVPREIDEIKSSDLAEAKRWQQQIRESFQTNLANGLYCANFVPGRDGANSRYLFYKDEFVEGRLNYE